MFNLGSEKLTGLSSNGLMRRKCKQALVGLGQYNQWSWQKETQGFIMMLNSGLSKWSSIFWPNWVLNSIQNRNPSNKESNTFLEKRRSKAVNGSNQYAENWPLHIKDNTFIIAYRATLIETSEVKSMRRLVFDQFGYPPTPRFLGSWTSQECNILVLGSQGR